MDCNDLITSARRNGVKRVDCSRFDLMLPEGQTFINRWAQRAIDRAGCRDNQSFEPFIFGWIALNGWASCVTGSESDQAIVNSLMLDPDLNLRFER
jgi:hypothetical protein